MFSSFPATEFPALRLSQEKESTHTIHKGTSAVRPAEDPSDETLIARVCADDSEALGLLFGRYARIVWTIAYRILRNSEEADDLLQDLFMLVHRKASVFDSSKGTARSLIVLMTYQCAFTRRRYLNARHSQAPIEAAERVVKIAAPPVPLYDESVEAHFGRERLRQALDEMSEDQRETLRLYFFEGYTLREVATQLGQSLGNVKHHYYRGLDRLRRHMPER